MLDHQQPQHGLERHEKLIVVRSGNQALVVRRVAGHQDPGRVGILLALQRRLKLREDVAGRAVQRRSDRAGHVDCRASPSRHSFQGTNIQPLQQAVELLARGPTADLRVVGLPERDKVLHAGQIRLVVSDIEKHHGIAGKLPGDRAAAFGRIVEGGLHERLPVKLEIRAAAGIEHFAAEPVPKLQLPPRIVLPEAPQQCGILQEADLRRERIQFVELLADGERSNASACSR